MQKVLRTNSTKFVIYSPILSNINSMINNDLHIIHADFDLKETFPRKSITAVYRSQKKNQRNVSTIFLSKTSL